MVLEHLATDRVIPKEDQISHCSRDANVLFVVQVRHMRDVLLAKGHEVHYQENMGGRMIT
jgi:enterochelin esterase-like enzyme